MDGHVHFIYVNMQHVVAEVVLVGMRVLWEEGKLNHGILMI